MEEFLVVTMGVMVIYSIGMFIWGIIILLSSKCKIRIYPVKGKRAKEIGLSFNQLCMTLVGYAYGKKEKNKDKSLCY